MTGRLGQDVPRRLVELRAGQVEDLLGPESVLLQPIGAVEQHGPHLPFATDLIVATSLAEAVVASHGAELDCYLLPPIAYSKSNEHDWCPGTVSLTARTLLSVIEDIGRALARLPVSKLVFLNGHGGNSSLLQVACREVHLATGLQTFLMHPSLPPDQGGAGDPAESGMGIHAGLRETSVMLYLRPDLVDMSVARANVPEVIAANRFVRFGGAVSFGWSSSDFGPSGVIGDPTAASAELGKELFEQMVPRLAEQLAEVRTFRYRTDEG